MGSAVRGYKSVDEDILSCVFVEATSACVSVVIKKLVVSDCINQVFLHCEEGKPRNSQSVKNDRLCYAK